MDRPILTETGTKYFLRETLKCCHKKNTVYFNRVLNFSLFSIFFIILGTVLIYRYRTKLTPKEKEENLKYYLLILGGSS